MFDMLALPSVILVTLTSLLLLTISEWRLNIIALGLQYIGVSLLVALSWPVEMAVTKLVAGWMSGAVLGMAMTTFPALRQSHPENPEMAVLPADEPAAEQPATGYLAAGSLFRILAAALLGLTVLSIAPTLPEWFPGITLTQAWGSLVLIGLGLLHLGLTANPFRTIIGLLTALSGFEILYAAVESSTLVAGLLAAVNLGLSLMGAYLVVAHTMEETE